jgi:sugar/nucleoside kinase (ribokinase family)
MTDRTTKTVVIVGDLNLDIIFSQINGQPAFGTELAAGDCIMKPGGSAANTAILLALNGCPVSFYSRVGRDFAGKLLVRRLEEYGVRIDTISFSDTYATGTTVSLTYPNDRMYITFPGTISSTVPNDLKMTVRSIQGHLHIASFFLQTGLRPYFGTLLKQAKKKGMSTSLDPGGDVAGKWDIHEIQDSLRYIDYFMPNREEFFGITGKNDIEEGLKTFPDCVSTVIVKAGIEGVFMRLNNEIVQYPALPVETVDTTCAGDGFNAGFLCGISRGMTIPDSVRLGNRFGAAVVSTLGFPLRRIE